MDAAYYTAGSDVPDYYESLPSDVLSVKVRSREKKMGERAGSDREIKTEAGTVRVPVRVTY